MTAALRRQPDDHPSQWVTVYEAARLTGLSVRRWRQIALRELAHGLACKHFGGECHEIGLMFLVFTPCLYCNVSDAWMLPNRWHRIAISAAGMIAEIGLASLCTF